MDDKATPTARPDSARDDDARVAGRGFLLITLAKVYFIATSAVVSLGLPRLFGAPALFGEFTVVNRFISVLNMVMIAGTIQAVAKAVSERDEVARAVKQKALVLQCFVGLPAFAILFALADIIAVGMFNDPALAPFLRVAALVFLFYGFYAVFVGVFNGQKRFRAQASLDITFSTLKTAFILGLVVLGFGVMGAFVGFAAAALVVLAIAAVASRHRGPRDAPGAASAADAAVSTKALFAFMAPVMLYTLLVYVLLSADNLLIKSLKYAPLVAHFGAPLGRLQLSLLTAPLGAALPSDPAAYGEVASAFAAHGTSVLAGFFGAMKNIATLPYQGIIAVTFVIFPLVSRATFEHDEARTRAYISQTFRYATLLLALIVTALVTASSELVVVLFGPAYAIGAPALSWLLVGIVLFSLFYIGNTIIAGSGRPGTAALITLGTVALNLVLGVLFLRGSDLWAGALTAAAEATLVSVAVGCGAVGTYLLKRHRAFLPPLTAARVVLLAAGIIAAARLVPVAGLIAVVAKMAAAAVLFLAGLVLLREFDATDLGRLKRVVGRRESRP